MPLGAPSPLRRLRSAAGRWRPAGRSAAILPDLFERRARRHPRRVCVRCEGRELSYAELNAAANRVAWWALGQRIGRGAAVGVLFENRPELLAVALGLAKVGARAALLPTGLGAEELRAALRAAGIARLIAGAECHDPVAELRAEEREALALRVLADPAGKPIALPSGARDLDLELRRHSERNPDRRARGRQRSGDPLFALFRSAQDGSLAPLSISHERFFAGAAPFRAGGFSRRDVLFCAEPLQQASSGLLALAAVLERGAALALARRFDAPRFLAAAAAAGATAFLYDERSCRLLLREPRPAAAQRARLALAFGSGLRADIDARFREHLGLRGRCEIYADAGAPLLVAGRGAAPGSLGRLGRRERRRVRLVRAEIGRSELPREAGCLVECDFGELGELIVRAADGAEVVEPASLLRNVLAPGDVWLRSGDLMRRSAEGDLHFAGRASESFCWRGHAFASAEVADRLAGFPDLALCSCYGVRPPPAAAARAPRGVEERAGAAALALAEGAAFDGRAFYHFARAVLPAQAVPRIVRILEPGALAGGALRVARLQREGFDPRRIKHRLYFCDDAAGRYLPLTAERYLEIEAGLRPL